MDSSPPPPYDEYDNYQVIVNDLPQNNQKIIMANEQLPATTQNNQVHDTKICNICFNCADYCNNCCNNCLDVSKVGQCNFITCIFCCFICCL